MSETNNVEVSTENTIDWEARAKKAEAKIVDMKNNQTETVKAEETPKTEPAVETHNYMTRADFEKEKFFEANSELVEHKDKINEYVSKGYSLEDAKTVLLAKDETIANRKTTQNSNFTDWVADIQQTSYTREELWDLPQAKYNEVMKLRKEGKITITN